ncbi:hypothetical protein MKEN_01275100 [Mycena kentingensis (nom. inval.)]|nr:hypothetical protein MKEN_01275100 [Mycena kentingensis (nom. inval.)]
MSSTTSDDNKPTDDKAAQINTSMEADLAALSALLTSDKLDDAGEANVDELLARMDDADGVAKGVENKLDGLLANLDNLLAALEEKQATTDESASETMPPPSSSEPPADDKE